MSDRSFKRITPTVEHFLNKTTVIYGKSGSGKTFIIKHILYLLRDHVPFPFIFSASEKNNGNYSTKIVPRNLIFDEIDGSILEGIATLQTKKKQLYQIATRLDVMKRLMKRVASSAELTVIIEFERVRDEMTAKAPFSDTEEALFKSQIVGFISKVYEQRMDALLQLKAQGELDKEECFTLEWFKFNPRIIIVFDDCSTDLSKLKTCATVLEQIFQGRHMNCTTIIGIHDDAMLSPGMRNNVNNSIFTDSLTARRWIDKGKFGKENRTELVGYSDQIRENTDPFTKFWFSGGMPALVEFPKHEPFDATCESVRQFCQLCAPKKSNSIPQWMEGIFKGASR
jgi:hypothetical protein